MTHSLDEADDVGMLQLGEDVAAGESGDVRHRYGRWGVMTSADPQSQAEGKWKLTPLLRAAACPAGSSWRN